ncbi:MULTISPECIES: hypothetical protein [unclassified Paenibacillus]|uniref:hypothetical protein n=1 Tax=unclassified Paenibacillus TaxID=185978 RepID=UPI003625DE3C
MIKSPIGIIFAAAAVVLAVSPEARKAVRRFAVKGTEVLLDAADQIKTRTSELNSESTDDEKNTEHPMLG